MYRYHSEIRKHSQENSGTQNQGLPCWKETAAFKPTNRTGELREIKMVTESCGTWDRKTALRKDISNYFFLSGILYPCYLNLIGKRRTVA
jgi:hypothetical protein